MDDACHTEPPLPTRSEAVEAEENIGSSSSLLPTSANVMIAQKGAVMTTTMSPTTDTSSSAVGKWE